MKSELFATFAPCPFETSVLVTVRVLGHKVTYHLTVFTSTEHETRTFYFLYKQFVEIPHLLRSNYGFHRSSDMHIYCTTNKRRKRAYSLS